MPDNPPCAGFLLTAAAAPPGALMTLPLSCLIPDIANSMLHSNIVKAMWDPEAQVYVVTSDDIHGFVTEATTLPELEAKLPGLVQDLMEEN